MSASAVGDESLKRFYQSIRTELEADRESMKRREEHFFTIGDVIKT
jgi:hypothetical protein